MSMLDRIPRRPVELTGEGYAAGGYIPQMHESWVLKLELTIVIYSLLFALTVFLIAEIKRNSK